MAKKNKSNTSDYIGFRAKNDKQKAEFYYRANTLKDKGISKADIFEAGLLALEKGNTIEQIQRKKNKAINERDSYLREAINLNNKIGAYNRQLKFKPDGRFKELNVKDNVLTIQFFDNEGNSYEF